MNKNLIIFFLNLCLCLSSKVSFSQTRKFELNGYIKGLKNGSISLRERILNQNINSTQNEITIQNGKFKFSGEIFDATEVRFVFNDTLFSNPFFLEFGKLEALINIDSLSRPIIIKGSKSNNEYLNTYMPKIDYYENKIESWYNDIWELEKKYDQKLPVQIKDSMEKIIKDISRKKDLALFKYIKTHPSSQVGLFNLYVRAYEHGYTKLYANAYNLLDKKLKQRKTGAELKKMLDAGKQTAEGVIFPSMNVVDSLGNFQHVFTKGLNKFTLIDFWFSDCLPCIRQFEEFKSIFSLFESKGFKISGVSIDKKEKELKWRTTVSKYGLRWPQYWDIDGKEASRLFINTFPSNFLLDKKGAIIAKNMEPFQLQKFLQENL